MVGASLGPAEVYPVPFRETAEKDKADDLICVFVYEAKSSPF